MPGASDTAAGQKVTTEVLACGLGSAVQSRSGVEVDNSRAHQLVLVQGHGGATASCPKNKVSVVQEKCLLQISPTIWDKVPHSIINSQGGKAQTQEVQDLSPPLPAHVSGQCRHLSGPYFLHL